METKKSRGVKKGESPSWNVGRKATGRVRDVNISFRVSEDEKKYIYEKLDKVGGKRTEALLKVLSEIK